MKESYSDDETNEIIDLCLEFIMFFLGEYMYDENSSMSQDSHSTSQPRKSTMSKQGTSQLIQKEVK